MLKAKRFIVATLVISMLFSLCACTTDEISYLDALKKIATAESYSSTGVLSIKLNATTPTELQEQMKPFNLQSILNALSDLKLAWGENTILTDNEMKSKVTMGFSTQNTQFVSNSYVTTDDGALKITFELPTIAKAFLPKENENAKYMLIDYSKFGDFTKEVTGQKMAFDFSDLMPQSRKLGISSYDGMLKIAKLLLDTPEITKKTKTGFSINLSDESLKKFAKIMVESYCDNEDTRKEVKSIVDEFMKLYEKIYPAEIFSSISQPVTSFFNMTQEELTSNKKNVMDMFDNICEVEILGAKGIVINVEMDKNNYISKADSTYDINIDINQIAEKITGNVAYEEPFIINALINVATDITNVNNVKSVDIPTFDEKNCVDYFAWLKSFMPTPDAANEHINKDPNFIGNVTLPSPDGNITVFNNKRKIDFNGLEPKLIDGNLYVALEPLLSSMYSSFAWDYHLNQGIISMYNDQFVIKSNDDRLYGDSYVITLNGFVKSFDNYLYVPLRSFIKSVYGTKVEWDAEKNCAIIGW